MNVDDLWEILDYEPDLGWFRWRVSRGGKVAGDRAGYRSPRGYWRVKIGRRQYQAGALAWFWMTGRWVLVDHRNLDRDDNRWSNLRETTPSLNQANRRTSNRWGAKGIWPARGSKDKWVAVINRRHLGTFDTKEAAAAAYAYAAADAYGEFMRL